MQNCEMLVQTQQGQHWHSFYQTLRYQRQRHDFYLLLNLYGHTMKRNQYRDNLGWELLPSIMSTGEPYSTQGQWVARTDCVHPNDVTLSLLVGPASLWGGEGLPFFSTCTCKSSWRSTFILWYWLQASGRVLSKDSRSACGCESISRPWL